MSACPKCQHIHVVGDAVALTRFTGVSGYRTPDGEIHATREDAQEWLCEQRSDPYDKPIGVFEGTRWHSHSEPICADPDCVTYLTREEMAAMRARTRRVVISPGTQSDYLLDGSPESVAVVREARGLPPVGGEDQ